MLLVSTWRWLLLLALVQSAQHGGAASRAGSGNRATRPSVAAGVAGVPGPGRAQAKASSAAGTRTCPEACTTHGTCNVEAGRCECPILKRGLDCSMPVVDEKQQCAEFSHTLTSCHGHELHMCLNSCNQPNGWCEAGFCVCKPGYYGADCSLTTDPASGRPALLADQGYVPRARGVKIYVYELPAVDNTWLPITRVDRPVMQALWQRLGSSGARTADGASADYFFIPFLLRTRLHAEHHLPGTIQYIAKHWPWWNKHKGHRHIIVSPGDTGRLMLSPNLQALTANVTFLVHWGLHRNHTAGRWRAAHRPELDIVIPPLLHPDDPLVFTPLHPNNTAQRKGGRPGLLYFSGQVCRDGQAPSEASGRCEDRALDKSAGVRQKVYEAHFRREGWTVVHQEGGHVAGLAGLLSSHQFCLSPIGYGYAKRSVQAVLMGCVPVLVADGAHQPFEPFLDWRQLGLVVREAEVAQQLHKAVEGVTDDAFEQYQARLPCAAQHLYYSSTLGGIMGEDGRYDAFETILEILRMRRDHPGLVPAKWAAKDKRFADFMACREAPADDGAGSGSGSSFQLCSHNRLIKGAQHCRNCYQEVVVRAPYAFYGWPGGAACCKERRVGRCPRAWT